MDNAMYDDDRAFSKFHSHLSRGYALSQLIWDSHRPEDANEWEERACL